jgi:hypothetical protein
MQQKRPLSKIIFNILICSCLITTGIVIGKCVNFSFFKVDSNINLVDVLTIVTTIYAVWYVSKVLDKEKQDKRTEKDLILKRTEDIYNLISNMREKVLRGNVPYSEASSHLKRISVSISDTYNILKSLKLSVSDEGRKNLLSNVRALRNLLTNTPIANIVVQNDQTTQQNPNSALPIQVINGVIHFNNNRIIEIESEYDKFKHNILLMQLSINKA